MRLLVIGGSDAGISAGLRALELDPSVEVTLPRSPCWSPDPVRQPRGPNVKDPGSELRVLFVCTHNAGRSIVAAALLNAQQPSTVRAESAGLDPAAALNPTAVTALAERGVGVAGVSPKPITAELLATADLVITMSRHATGPALPQSAVRRQHWQLGFPGDDLDAMRVFCDQVDQRVQALLADLVPPPG